ncbi:hypothetical protein B7R22_04215 [Subtercola boreus]|uniref:AAA domain-containing protein n=1 Tax=Subtercola boreus TaxID=120213 RepID=A0A3E0W2B5_9MICO|nr:AAA family ATPase [Subtercola boreus]RFA16140.1 hypothetical protein B7R22_04215 [Subtercola boreus]
MAIDKSRVLDTPHITAVLRGDNTGVLRVDGEEQHIAADSAGSALQELVGLIQGEAENLGRPVRVTVTAETGRSILLADEDGSIEEESFVPAEELDASDGLDEEDGADGAEAVAESEAPQGLEAPDELGGTGTGTGTDSAIGEMADEGDDDTEDTNADDTDTEDPETDEDAVEDPDESDDPVPAPVPLPAPLPVPLPASARPALALTPERSESPMPTPSRTVASPVRGARTTASSVRATPSAQATPSGQGTPAGSSRQKDLLDAPSFLAVAKVDEPAEQGLKGFLNHLGFHFKPGPTEQAQRSDIEAISRHFPAHRTISVINRKGGANKTPTVANLAAAFARSGGGGVLAWDNNETMGTLGWRTERGEHESTVLDVLANADDLLDARAEFGQMSRFVHHQQADKFDVLRSDEDPSGTHEMTAEEVDIVHSIAAKYYRLILMDSGNSDRAENWLRMIDHTDQLVVPTTTMEDRAQAALLTLQAVQSRSEKAAELAKNAVVVISEWQPKEQNISERMADDFRPYVRDVVIVPFDPALKAGRILHSSLQPATRRAWLAAAAAVAKGL